VQREKPNKSLKLFITNIQRRFIFISEKIREKNGLWL